MAENRSRWSAPSGLGRNPIVSKCLSLGVLDSTRSDCRLGARKLEKYLTRQFEQQVARTNVEREQKYRVADIRPIRPRADQVPFIQ